MEQNRKKLKKNKSCNTEIILYLYRRGGETIEDVIKIV